MLKSGTTGRIEQVIHDLGHACTACQSEKAVSAGTPRVDAVICSLRLSLVHDGRSNGRYTKESGLSGHTSVWLRLRRVAAKCIWQPVREAAMSSSMPSQTRIVISFDNSSIWQSPNGHMLVRLKMSYAPLDRDVFTGPNKELGTL